MFVVSNSKLNTWRRCHYSYYLKYILKLEKKVKPGPLQRGSIIHECLEEWNSGRSWKKPLERFTKEFYDNTFAEERLELGDLPKMVQELLEAYTHYYTEEEEFEYIQNELHFELPLTKEIAIQGYIDSIVEDERGRVWSMETKTYTRTPDRDFLLFNPQSATYIWALRELGYEPEGMLWNILKAKEPTKPRLTQKTQKLSLAKLDSTPYTIRKGIKELGLDPKDYEDFIGKHDYDGYFYRHQIRLNKNVVESIMDDTLSTALEVYEQGGVLKDKNLNRDCSWCSYRSICQAELMALDVDYIIEAEYQTRSREENDNGKEEKETSKKTRRKRVRNRK